MSLLDDCAAFLRCPGCKGQTWDLRAKGIDDLPNLEGTFCCETCGQAFSARGGVLDMDPSIVETKSAAFRRRMLSSPLVRYYEENFRHFLTPLTSSFHREDWESWLRQHAPQRTSVQLIVDFGCGAGNDLQLMQEFCNPQIAIGIDLSPVLLAEAARMARLKKQKNVLFIRANIERLPLAPRSFEWANCYGLLHRLHDPAQSLVALASLLQENGIFTCLTTLKMPPGIVELGQLILNSTRSVHIFEKKTIIQFFQNAALDLENFQDFGSVALLSGHLRK